MIAKLRQYRISPKKANLVAALVRRKTVTEAVNMLKFTNKKAATPLKKLIESAAANATHNFKQDPEKLIVNEIIVTEGPTYKRSIPISRGRMHPILKRTSHITVKLTANLAPTVQKDSKAQTSPTPKAEKKNDTEKAQTKDQSKKDKEDSPSKNKETK